MKKIFTFLFLAAITMLMTSCENDREIAKNLSGGIWEGEVTYWTGDYYGRYENYQYVDIKFYNNPYEYSAGHGVEYDYYSSNSYTTIGFTYQVTNGWIYLYYNNGMDVVVRNYRLYSDLFEGDFYTTGGRKMAEFRFTRYDNWRHDRYNYYYYAPETPSDTITVK